MCMHSTAKHHETMLRGFFLPFPPPPPFVSGMGAERSISLHWFGHAWGNPPMSQQKRAGGDIVFPGPFYKTWGVSYETLSVTVTLDGVNCFQCYNGGSGCSLSATMVFEGAGCSLSATIVFEGAGSSLSARMVGQGVLSVLQ